MHPILRTVSLITVFCLIVGLWLLCPNLVIRWYGYPDQSGGFGDIFGAINSLFAGLAFFGIIVTILLQRQELRQNTTQLSHSATALAQQVKLMGLSATLSALPELILQEKLRIGTAAGRGMWKFSQEFVNFQDMSFTVEQLTDKLSRVRGDGCPSRGVYRCNRKRIVRGGPSVHPGPCIHSRRHYTTRAAS